MEGLLLTHDLRSTEESGLNGATLVPAKFSSKMGRELFIEQDAHRSLEPQTRPQGPQSLALAKREFANTRLGCVGSIVSTYRAGAKLGFHYGFRGRKYTAHHRDPEK